MRFPYRSAGPDLEIHPGRNPACRRPHRRRLESGRLSQRRPHDGLGIINFKPAQRRVRNLAPLPFDICQSPQAACL